MLRSGGSLSELDVRIRNEKKKGLIFLKKKNDGGGNGIDGEKYDADTVSALCSLNVPTYNDFLPFVDLTGSDIGGYYILGTPAVNPLETLFGEGMERSFNKTLNSLVRDDGATYTLFGATPEKPAHINPLFKDYTHTLKQYTHANFSAFQAVLSGILDRELSVLPMLSHLLSPPFKEMAFAAMIVWGGAVVAVLAYIPAVCILMCGRDAWDRGNAAPKIVPVDGSIDEGRNLDGVAGSVKHPPNASPPGREEGIRPRPRPRANNNNNSSSNNNNAALVYPVNSSDCDDSSSSYSSNRTSADGYDDSNNEGPSSHAAVVYNPHAYYPQAYGVAGAGGETADGTGPKKKVIVKKKKKKSGQVGVGGSISYQSDY